MISYVQLSVRPWLVVVPLAALGILLGHEAAYAISGAPRESVHAYLHQLPQIALILIVLAAGGAALAGRSARIVFWPYPLVAVSGFVIQEHLERLQHTGSLPFLLDQGFFLVGIAVQCLIACALWVVARLLVSTLAAEESAIALSPVWATAIGSPSSASAPGAVPVARRSRGPPSSR